MSKGSSGRRQDAHCGCQRVLAARGVCAERRDKGKKKKCSFVFLSGLIRMRWRRQGGKTGLFWQGYNGREGAESGMLSQPRYPSGDCCSCRCFPRASHPHPCMDSVLCQQDQPCFTPCPIPSSPSPALSAPFVPSAGLGTMNG